MNFIAGTYGWVDRDGSILGTYTSQTDFVGREGCFSPIVVDDQPAYDTATQKLVASYVIDNGVFRQQWTIVALTDAELWSRFQSGDYVDAMTSIRLKTTDNAMNYFTAQAVLLQVALASSAITTSSNVQIWDAFGQPHTLTAMDMMGLLLRYGFAYQTAYASFAP